MTREEWLQWRLGKITASDAACLYNANPYKSLEKLFNEKIADKPEEGFSNIAMRRGIELEPILREHFVKWWAQDNGHDPFEAKNCEHPEFDFIGASLDGLSRDGKTLVEIKYVGQKIFGLRQVPKHYWMQVQHQMLASGAELGYVCMGVDENTFTIIPVERDNAFINSHLILCQAFWLNVQTRKAPPSSVEVVSDESALKLATLLKEQLLIQQQAEEQIKLIREEILKFCTRDETLINDIRIKKVITKGSIKYAELEEIKALDLERYRSPEKTSWRITMEKSK